MKSPDEVAGWIRAQRPVVFRGRFVPLCRTRATRKPGFRALRGLPVDARRRAGQDLRAGQDCGRAEWTLLKAWLSGGAGGYGGGSTFDSAAERRNQRDF